jgi:hypothetical protein
MTGLGYTPTKLTNGEIAFKDANGGTYFNNGRVWTNGKGSNYDYNTLTRVQSTPVMPKNTTPTALTKSAWVTGVNGGYNTYAEALG